MSAILVGKNTLTVVENEPINRLLLVIFALLVSFLSHYRSQAELKKVHLKLRTCYTIPDA